MKIVAPDHQPLGVNTGKYESDKKREMPPQAVEVKPIVNDRREVPLGRLHRM